MRTPILRGLASVAIAGSVCCAVRAQAASLPVTGGLQVWLDASNVDGSNNSTVSVGSPFAPWVNLSADAASIGDFDLAGQSTRWPTLETVTINGQSARVARFDGVDDVLWTGTSLADTLDADMTMFVVADSRQSGPGAIVSTRRSTTGWALRYQDPSNLLYYHNAVGTSLTYHDLTLDDFNLVQLARDGSPASAAVQLSHNGGTPDSRTIDSLNTTGNTGTMIARNYDSTDYLAGDFAEVIIYDRPLSEAEQNQVGVYLEEKYGMNTAFSRSSHYTETVLNSNPVVYYRFDDATSAAGQTTTNFGSGGIPLDGIYAGNVALVDSYGLLDKAASLNGATDHVGAFDDDAIDFTDGITIEAWVNREAGGLTSFERIVSKDFSTAYALTMNQNGHGGFAAGGPLLLINGNTYVVGSQTSIMDGEWHHVVATYDGQYMKMYVDGVLEGTTPFTGTIGVNTNNLAVGVNKSFNGERFRGLLDEVALYGRALGPGEIDQHYRAAIPEPATVVLLALGGFCLLAQQWRKRSRQPRP